MSLRSEEESRIVGKFRTNTNGCGRSEPCSLPSYLSFIRLEQQLYGLVNNLAILFLLRLFEIDKIETGFGKL